MMVEDVAQVESDVPRAATSAGASSGMTVHGQTPHARPLQAEPRCAERMARARHALAVAETIAWFGAQPDRGSGVPLQADACSKRATQAAGGFGATEARLSRSRRTKAVRMQECARDIKRFLALRDSGVRAESMRPADGTAICNDGEECDARISKDSVMRPVESRAFTDSGAMRPELLALPSARARYDAWRAMPRVTLGDPGCDAALGGGLVCGALHEIQGVYFGDPVRLAPAGASWNTAANTAADQGWIVPFGCLLHLTRLALAHPALAGRTTAWIGSRVHPARHAMHVLHAPRLRHEIHSVRRMESFVLDEDIANHSVCIADTPHGAADGDRMATGWSAHPAATARKSEAHPCTAQAKARLWCAEQAIRLGAAGIVVVDGSGFDQLAWRRLQRAASAARECSADETVADDGAPLAMSASQCAPLILVVTPPEQWESAGVRQQGLRHDRSDRNRACEPASPQHPRRVRTAATQWAVHATFSAHRRGDAPVEACVGTSARDASLGFRWSMVLTRFRPGHGGGTDASAETEEAWAVGSEAPTSGHPSDAANVPPLRVATRGSVVANSQRMLSRSTYGPPARDVQAAIAGQLLRLRVESPRTVCTDEAWDLLRVAGVQHPREEAYREVYREVYRLRGSA